MVQLLGLDGPTQPVSAHINEDKGQQRHSKGMLGRMAVGSQLNHFSPVRRLPLDLAQKLLSSSRPWPGLVVGLKVQAIKRPPWWLGRLEDFMFLPKKTLGKPR